ncbi:MAG: cyclase family protein [Candidatus Bathyarchaeia archaeon]
MLIDLTHPFFNGMLYNWYIPEMPKPYIRTIREAEPGEDRLGFQEVLFATHMGTHIDAQMHWDHRGRSIDEYPLERFLGPAICLDVSDVGRLGKITSSVLEEKDLGVCSGDMLLLHTGYGQYFISDYHKYYEQPYLTSDAAQWIIDKGVGLVGIDGHTVDKPFALRSMAFVPGVDRNNHHMSPDGPHSRSIHDILLSKDVLIIEHMANLDKVAGKKFELIVAPMKIRRGDGAPARCIAVVE